MSPAVFSHGALRLYLLSLLAEAPQHGYELIQSLSDRFGGTYSPSAGTIYPRLSKLEEDGLVTKSTNGRKTVYEITDAGREELAAREGELNAIEDEVTDSVRRLADEVRAGVNRAMKSLRADLASAARQATSDATGTATGARRDARAAEDSDRAAETATGSAAQHDVDSRVESRLALRDAELALNEFRQQIRADLRTAGARDRIPPRLVAQLRAGLAQVRADILKSLGDGTGR